MFSFRFTFNLCTPSGIALHINPRFHLGCVVRNTDRGGWGAEERAGPFPFAKGQPFEMIIAVDHDRYRVFKKKNFCIKITNLT
jgi:hypothetical protein